MNPLIVYHQEDGICIRTELSRYWRRRAQHLRRIGRPGNVVVSARVVDVVPGLDGMTWSDVK